MLRLPGLQMDLAKLDSFFDQLEAFPETGVIVVDDRRIEQQLADVLQVENYEESLCWDDALERLSQGLSTFIVLNPLVTKELVQIGNEYQARGGLIRLLDKLKSTGKKAALGLKKTKLLVVGSTRTFKRLKKMLGLRNNSGLISNAHVT
jgi:hypothetical protein